MLKLRINRRKELKMDLEDKYWPEFLALEKSGGETPQVARGIVDGRVDHSLWSTGDEFRAAKRADFALWLYQNKKASAMEAHDILMTVRRDAYDAAQQGIAAVDKEIWELEN